jgi:oligopeptide transport system ATP-binding protein
MDSDEQQDLASIEGMPPVLREKPSYCPFAPRCRFVVEKCMQENPPLLDVAPGHRVACWVDTETGRLRP